MRRCYSRAAPACAFVLALLGPITRLPCAGAAAISTTSDADRATVAALVMNAVTQVKLCGFALEKSRNADVRALCRKASADSARTALVGMQLAQTIGATDAKLEPESDTPQMIDKLAQFSGNDFDREFLLAQIARGEDEENTLTYEVEVTADTSVKRYENTVLPKIEAHLELAETALRTVSEAAP